MTFIEKPTGDPEIRLKILSTELGTLHFGERLPGWLERFITARVNGALKLLWSSKLGDWISDKISDLIKNGHFPKGTNGVRIVSMR